jgi:hypothetical protein
LDTFTPDVKVNPEHLPFVPNKPLFSNSGKTYHPPGSQAWYQHIYRAYFAAKDRGRLNELQRKSNEETAIARYHGTSRNKFKSRKKKTAWLTTLQYKYHRLAHDTIRPINTSITNEHTDKLARTKRRWYGNLRDYVPDLEKRPVDSDTSEETRRIKTKKNKRQGSEVIQFSKKLRPMADCPDDHTTKDD